MFSLFAVGLCCRDAAKAVADRRQSLSAPTTAGPAAPQAAAAPHGFGPAFLDPAYRWFVSWETSLLIVKAETVLRWHRQGWRSYWRRRSSRRGKTGRPPIAHPDPADEHGEPSVGPAKDPGGVGAAGVQSLRENDSQVYASNPPSRAVFPLAVIPEAAYVGHLRVRLLLRPDHNV